MRGRACFAFAIICRRPGSTSFLSHAHLDHTFGLTVLLDALFEKDVERVTVHGDAAKLAAIEQHLFAPEIFPVAPPFVSRPIEQGLRLACGAQVTHFPLDHPGGSIGYRFDWKERSLGLCHRHDLGGPKVALHSAHSRRRSTRPRMQFPRRAGSLGRKDRPQLDHARRPRRRRRRREAARADALQPAGHESETPSAWPRPARSFQPPIWRSTGWQWSFEAVYTSLNRKRRKTHIPSFARQACRSS